MNIDCYGREAGSPQYFGRPKRPYQIDVQGEYRYRRYSPDMVGPVHRSKGEETLWTYGSWYGRKYLEYLTPLDKPIDITVFSGRKIDFSTLDEDLLKRAVSRLMWQFRNSPVIRQTLMRATIELQESRDATKGVIEGRSIYDAKGVSLDVLGELVGQPRKYMRNISDDNYRRFIYGKIFKNHTLGGSNPENRTCASYVTDTSCSFVKRGLQYYRLAFPVGVDLDVVQILKTKWRNNQIDSYYMLPIPSTVLLDTDVAFLVPTDGELKVGFGPDEYEMRPDYARTAIGARI